MDRPCFTLLLRLSLSAFFALSISCATKGNRAEKSELTPAGGRDAGSQGDGPKKPSVSNQGQAVQMLLTANEAEIKEAEVAKSRAADPEVHRFAAMLIEDHTGADKRLKALVEEKGIKPEVSQASDRLKFDSDSAVSHIKNITASMFDHAFMSRALNVHKSALTLIDEDLSKVVEDPDLKGELAAERAMFQQHLDDATAILEGLPMTSSSSSSSIDAGATDSGAPSAEDAGLTVDDPPPDAGAE